MLAATRNSSMHRRHKLDSTKSPELSLGTRAGFIIIGINALPFGRKTFDDMQEDVPRFNDKNSQRLPFSCIF